MVTGVSGAESSARGISIVFEKDRPFYGTPAQAVKMWGPPKQRFDTGRYAILVYDINLLDGFPPHC